MSRAKVALIRATVRALLVVCIVMPAGPTRAQFPFWQRPGLWWNGHASERHEHRHRHAKPELAEKDQAPEAPNGPLEIIISIADQRVSVYDNGALIARSSVSTGIPLHPTPLGVFSVISKQRWHRSNLYSAAPMPYMQRITWSGIALHAGILPGHPASHGCIRLKNDFAIRLWHLTKPGARVIIASDDIRPVEIASPRLFESKPQPTSTPPESRSDLTATVNITPDGDAQQVADPPTPGSTQTADKPRKLVPISVFVSRKSSKLFVRRGSTPLFDTPVQIRDPQESLGTHVFTAMAPQTEGAGLRWTVVSMPEDAPRKHPKGRHTGKHSVEVPPSVPSTDKAKAALDRIEIPQETIERISQLLTPGSSLIVSDYGLSEETGSDTGFIVETH